MPASSARDEYRKPSEAIIRKAGEVEIYDAKGKPISFRSLYTAKAGQHRRVMVIFIRHFFCGVCQEYLKVLANGVKPSSLPADVSIAIVGCGAPQLISWYAESLGFEKSYPYPIYADQNKQLYNLFEMESNLDQPSTKPKYLQDSVIAVTLRSMKQMIRRSWHGDAASGGAISQNGGEFLFVAKGDQEADITWCHRMMNTQGHAEIEEVRSVLKLTGE